MLVARKLWKRNTVYKASFNFALFAINNSTPIQIGATIQNMVCTGSMLKKLYDNNNFLKLLKESS